MHVFECVSAPACACVHASACACLHACVYACLCVHMHTFVCSCWCAWASVTTNMKASAKEHSKCVGSRSVGSSCSELDAWPDSSKTIFKPRSAAIISNQALLIAMCGDRSDIWKQSPKQAETRGKRGLQLKFVRGGDLARTPRPGKCILREEDHQVPDLRGSSRCNAPSVESCCSVAVTRVEIGWEVWR
jgi:hypothetical protein